MPAEAAAEVEAEGAEFQQVVRQRGPVGAEEVKIPERKSSKDAFIRKEFPFDSGVGF